MVWLLLNVSWRKCGKIPKGFVSPTFAKCVIIILVSHVKAAAAIELIKHPGEAIHALIFRIAKEMPKHIKFDKC